MWLATTRGFYSAVKHRDKPHTVLVRARARKDLKRLIELAPDKGLKIKKTLERADYPYRMEVPQRLWVDLLAVLASEIDYDNFKTAVGKKSKKRAGLYSRVWSIMLDAEKEDPGVRAYERKHWPVPILRATTVIERPGPGSDCTVCGERWYNCFCPRDIGYS